MGLKEFHCKYRIPVVDYFQMQFLLSAMQFQSSETLRRHGYLFNQEKDGFFLQRTQCDMRRIVSN